MQIDLGTVSHIYPLEARNECVFTKDETLADKAKGYLKPRGGGADAWRECEDLHGIWPLYAGSPESPSPAA
jgi:hypothetical protein